MGKQIRCACALTRLLLCNRQETDYTGATHTQGKNALKDRHEEGEGNGHRNPYEGKRINRIATGKTLNIPGNKKSPPLSGGDFSCSAVNF